MALCCVSTAVQSARLLLLVSWVLALLSCWTAAVRSVVAQTEELVAYRLVGRPCAGARAPRRSRTMTQQRGDERARCAPQREATDDSDEAPRRRREVGFTVADTRLWILVPPPGAFA